MILLKFAKVSQGVESLGLSLSVIGFFYGNPLVLFPILYKIFDGCTTFFLRFYDGLIHCYRVFSNYGLIKKSLNLYLYD